MKSSWEATRAQSTYHFDPTKIDRPQDVVQRMRSFSVTPGWAEAVQQVIDNARPATWATRGYKGEGKDIPPADLESEEYDLTSHGISKDLPITHLTWKVPPIFQAIADEFELKDAMVRMHVQQPGEMWNLHIDKLGKWCPEDPSKVTRIFVQLTDWQLGQFYQFGNYNWSQWRAGDCVSFDWANMPHCTANAGYHPRVTMQITGVRS